MYGDHMGGISVEYLKERYFAPHPYAYPVIGSTQNLKNPRLSEMRKFFESYYVASNMGLILSGDFWAGTDEIENSYAVCENDGYGIPWCSS